MRQRGSRILLLLGLVIAAAAAVFLFVVLQNGINPQPGPDAIVQPTPITEVDVVVARIDIPRGTVITDTETYLRVERIPQSDFDQAGDYIRSIDQARDQLVTSSIGRNARLRLGDITEPGLSQQIPTAEPDQPRTKAYPILVNNLSGVADLIQQGDRVDVLSSFIFERQVVAAAIGVDPTTQLPEIQPAISEYAGRSTRTIVQNVEVLRIVRLQQPSGTPTAGAAAEEVPVEEPTPQTDESGAVIEEGEGQPAEGDTVPQGANWYLVVAVTDQEAELIKFAQEQNGRLQLVLRGSGDDATEDTTGVTLDLMVSQYGLPVPDPFISREREGVTPVPTVVPSPSPAP
jgi:pilus assembly protein CpaB